MSSHSNEYEATLSLPSNVYGVMASARYASQPSDHTTSSNHYRPNKAIRTVHNFKES